MSIRWNPLQNSGRGDFDIVGDGGGSGVTSVTGTTGRITVTPTTGDVVVDLATNTATPGFYPPLAAAVDAYGRVSTVSTFVPSSFVFAVGNTGPGGGSIAGTTLALLGDTATGITVDVQPFSFGTTIATISGIDASTSQKGVASYNSTYFSTSSGVVSLSSGVVTSLGLANTALQNIVEDTTPQLGGLLDTNGNNIFMTHAGSPPTAMLYNDSIGNGRMVVGYHNPGAGVVIGGFFQAFGDNYGNLNQRGGAFFVFSNNNSGTGGFTIQEHTPPSTYVTQFRVQVGGNVFVNNAIELGNATDTTLSRFSAGQIAVEGIQVVTVSNVVTMTNKTLTSPISTDPLNDFTQEPTINLSARGPRIAQGLGILSGEAWSNTAKLIYLDPLDGRWWQTDANNEDTTAGMLGIAIGGAMGAGGAVNAAIEGSIVRHDTWNWTPGVTLYVSPTVGGITDTPPSTTGQFVRIIGYALTDDCIYFSPSAEYTEVP